MSNYSLNSHTNRHQVYLYSPKNLGNALAVSTTKLIDVLNFFVVLVSVLVIALCFRIIANFNYKAYKESAKDANHYSLLEAI